MLRSRAPGFDPGAVSRLLYEETRLGGTPLLQQLHGQGEAMSANPPQGLEVGLGFPACLLPFRAPCVPLCMDLRSPPHTHVCIHPRAHLMAALKNRCEGAALEHAEILSDP